MRGAAPRLRPGGDAGAAGGARGRRAGGKHRARDAGRVHSRLRCRRAACRRVHAAPAGASERPGVAARRGGGRGEAARPRCRRGQPRDAHRDDAAADAELYERGRRRDGAERRRRHERLCRRAGARIWRWPGSRRRTTRSRRRSGSWSAAASPPDGMLDELGTRWEITRNYFRLYACCNPIHPALDCLAAALAELRPAPGGGRADRGRDLPLRLGDAQPGPAELFRLEILAAACRGGDGRARRRRLRRARRQRARPIRSSPRCASACRSARTRR